MGGVISTALDYKAFKCNLNQHVSFTYFSGCETPEFIPHAPTVKSYFFSCDYLFIHCYSLVFVFLCVA